jgi:hypothetical protein
MSEEEKYHRESIYKWVVISDSEDEDDDYGTHYVCKGDGFKFFIVGSTNTYEDAEEMAIAMNYWETRPTTMGETPH